MPSSTLQLGTYNCKLISAGLDQIGDNKTPAIALEYDVQHFLVGDNWQQVPEGHTARILLFLSEKAEPYTLEKIAKMGFVGDFDALARGICDDEIHAFFDAAKVDQVELVYKYDGHNPKYPNKWDFPGGNYERNPPGRDDVRTWNAKFKNMQQRTAAPAGKPSAPPARPSASNERPAPPPREAQPAQQGAGKDDDLPFDRE